MADDYEMLEELGSGSFGVVYKALERSTGEFVAIKHIDLDGTEDDLRDIQQEIALLSTCSSPYVTRYKTSFVRGTKLWIVMEYLGGGSCLDLVKVAPFSEDHVAIICRELLLGLDYIHTTGKIHRDIKAANILLSQSGKVKIADFGVAAQLTNIKSQRMTFVGTPFWMAPEVIKELGYDFKADIWSLGITTIELLKGEPPNAEMHPMKALMHVPRSPPPRLEGQFGRDIKSFVAACLVKDADSRPSARDLLHHRFIQRAGRVELLRDVIQSRQRQWAKTEESNHVRYYEETLRDMSPNKQEDDWTFETIRPCMNVVPQQPTIKKRKISETISLPLEPPTEMLGNLDLNSQSSISRKSPPTPPQTIRNIKLERDPMSTARKVASPMKQSAASPMKQQVASPSKPPRSISAQTQLTSRGIPSPSPRKSSGQQKQPLALDMSFGNGQSSTRPFRRVSNQSPTAAPTAQEHTNNENIPPIVDATTKEAKLGRRLFSKVINPALQEVYVQTANKTKQEALANAGEALAALDALYPEGEFLLLRAMFDRIQNDPKLLAILQPQPPATTANPPPMPPSSAVPSSTPSTPQKSKLILASNNPHLENHHKQRQSSQVSLISGASNKPLHILSGQTAPGMEHTKQLADALYGRWVEGLRTRWPQA